ncbi:hypothetical protein Q4508_15235 [Amphritea sp. 2_MG-2023]|uniref:hypothetical protein n=1 Tax=Amphritea TaxID=515417 RepID=UPI001C072A16|nr:MULTISPECIES: hypothetical protein [Amphritea]MBU2964926.1 hypothetical protein [Amphritea atlantica]MDO6419911.1 hypothetical protein [Amphritea sp. 2_MG-2023]
MPCHCKICGFEKPVTSNFKRWPGIPGFKLDFYPVTQRGLPDGEVMGFICSRCLQSANKMRSYTKGMMLGVEVSRHAVNRYIERTKADIDDFDRGRVAVIRAFSKAKKIKFKDEYTVKRIISNNYNYVDYYWVGDLVFVVTSNQPKTIVTVERLWGKKLNEDFFVL